ncbi:Retrovirus-related Pol polyprotein from transposon 17.6 [Labeo rohita]|uniref:ribonuclease H n=1 Tax=Labeo rohita TaxID=84645 RepID=A0ABQ8L6L5_LABRO|nr:Retrovirus-related Pol polyprotein from transposon 17.6 [Labeo rohita]
MSGRKSLVKSGESRPRFRLCVPPCKRYITSGDTHSMCVVCLGAEHAMALFEEGAFTSVPQGAGPASAEAERALHSWGLQMDLLEGMETGDPLTFLTRQVRCLFRGFGSPLLPPKGRALLSTCHPPKRETWRVRLRSHSLNRRSTRSCCRWLLVLKIDWPAEKDRVFLLDASLQPSGLFGDAVDSVVSRYQKVHKQAAAFQRFLPRRSLASTAAGCEQPSPCTSSSYRKTRGTLGRGPPRRGPTCGWCFSLGGPRPQSGPDARPGLLRAAPIREQRVAPLYTVSVSPRCPREVSLLSLPALQGTTASGECRSRISPPGLVAERGRLSPPRGSLEQLFRQSPAGPPLQGSELAVQQTPEASLERLVPLVDYLAAWKLLPNVSAWVLRTVEKGYAIQFGAPPPPFDGVFPTLVGPEQALVMEQEGETFLRKGAIEVVPAQDRESGFYSRYFIVPKKDGGLRLIIDLCRLNRSVMKPKFLRFAFRGEAYQYRVLPFDLALSPRTFTKCVDAALVPLRLQGIRILNYIDDWLILAASEKDHLSGCGVGFDHDAGTSVPCSDRVDPRRIQESQRRPVTHCQAVPTTAGSDGSCVERDTFWPAVHETPTVVAQNQRVSPRGNTLRMIKVTRRGLRALDMWRKPWFLNQGPVLGARRRVTLATGASLTGWGAVMSGRSARDLRDRHVLVRTDSTAVVYNINHQGGQTPLSASSAHSWASECGSRRPVKAGAEARGMDASPRGGEADLESLWSGSSGFLRHEGEHAMSPLVLSSSSSSPGAGCYGTDVAKASSVRLSPNRSAPGSSGESTPGWDQPTTSSPVLAGPSMVLGPGISPRMLSMGDSRQEGSPLTGRGHYPSPPPGVVEAVGVASEGAQLIASGLSTEVVETILQSRAPSTRKLYALKWKLFTSWCEDRQQDSVNPLGSEGVLGPWRSFDMP